MPDPNVLSLLANAGLAGLSLFLFIKGWIVPKPSVDRSEREAKQQRQLHDREVARLEREVERWRQLHEKECEAHAVTRRAHVEEIRPALQVNAEVARTAVHLLTSVKEIQSGAQERP